ncbi:hypothetical protein MICABA_03029 [Microbacterium sp. T2.11-28]|nr:hypothetical protein MICABA_03029 [Microbacterium sp. T2.11-28]
MVAAGGVDLGAEGGQGRPLGRDALGVGAHARGQALALLRREGGQLIEFGALRLERHHCALRRGGGRHLGLGLLEPRGEVTGLASCRACGDDGQRVAELTGDGAGTALGLRLPVAERFGRGEILVGHRVRRRVGGARVGRRSADGARFAVDESRRQLARVTGEPALQEGRHRRGRCGRRRVGPDVRRFRLVGLRRQRRDLARGGEPVGDGVPLGDEVGPAHGLGPGGHEGGVDPLPLGGDERLLRVELGQLRRAVRDGALQGGECALPLVQVRLGRRGGRPQRQVAGEPVDHRREVVVVTAARGAPCPPGLVGGLRRVRPLRLGAVRGLHGGAERLGGARPRQARPLLVDAGRLGLPRGQLLPRRGELREPLRLRGRLGQGRLGLGEGRLGPGAIVHSGVEAVLGALERGRRLGAAAGEVDSALLVAAEGVLVDELLGDLEQGAGVLARRIHGLLRVPPAHLELVAVALEAPRAEQRPQERLTFAGGGEQEAREPVLREEDHLLELLGVEPQDLVEQQADLSRLGRLPDPDVADELFQLRPWGLGRHPPAALGGAVVLGRAGDAQAPVARGELQAHLGRVAEEAVVGAQPPLTALVARHGAVEGEAHPVEDARLARSGAPRDEEDPVAVERVEVDALMLAERSEARHVEAVQLHADASTRTRSARTSSMSSCSRSLGPAPSRTCCRKAVTSSRSLRAERTRST